MEQTSSKAKSSRQNRSSASYEDVDEALNFENSKKTCRHYITFCKSHRTAFLRCFTNGCSFFAASASVVLQAFQGDGIHLKPIILCSISAFIELLFFSSGLLSLMETIDTHCDQTAIPGFSSLGLLQSSVGVDVEIDESKSVLIQKYTKKTQVLNLKRLN